MTTDQIKLARTLMGKIGATESKDELALAHSNGRTSHLTEMNKEEARSLIDFLKQQANVKQKPDPKERQIKKIYSLAIQTHHTLPNGKGDPAWINHICLTRTTEKKPLKQFALNELPRLVTVFEKIRNSFEKGL